MHEATILAALLRRIEDERQRHGARRVIAVYVRIGELSGVVPAFLQSALEAARAAGICDDLRLEIEAVACRWVCPSCGEVAEDAGAPRCRVCHDRPRLAAGDELLLTGLDLEMP